jgi:hypothetical protein
MKESNKLPFYKKKWFVPFVIILIVVSIFQSKNDKNVNHGSTISQESDCEDQRAYDLGFKEGANNRNKSFLVDCDYMWKLDNDFQMSKECFCLGYDKGFNK